MDMSLIYDITSLLNFNIENRVPLLIIGYNDQEDFMLSFDYPVAYINTDNFKNDIARVASVSESDKVPGLIVLEKEAWS